MLLKALAFFLVALTAEAGIVMVAWNMGFAPMFHLGKIDFAGACAIVALFMTLTGRLGVVMNPRPRPTKGATNSDKPPATF